MSEKIVITCFEDGVRVINQIADLLNGKTIEVISYHSLRRNDPLIWQFFSLAQLKPIINGTLFKLPLFPRRQLVFDLKDSPVIIFESIYRFDLVRKLSVRDTLTRIVLINY